MAAAGIAGMAVRALSPQRPARPAADSAPPPVHPDLGAPAVAPEAAVMERVAGDPPPKKVQRPGTFGERWRDRMSRSAVADDLSLGCCPRKCSDRLTVDQVFSEREEQKRHDAESRRLTLRTYLEDYKLPSARLGYNLHTSDGHVSGLCPTAFGLLRGYGKSYMYAYIRRGKDGVGHGDKSLGGQRFRGV